MGLLDELNWAEMKNYRALCTERTDRLRDEIDKLHREEALKQFELQRKEANLTQVKVKKATFNLKE